MPSSTSEPPPPAGPAWHWRQRPTLASIVVRTLGAMALAALLIYVCGYLGLVLLIGSAASTREAPEFTLADLRVQAGNIGIKIPPSARLNDAFVGGIRDYDIWVRFELPDRDLPVYRDQKLLRGKWQTGKPSDGHGFPRVVRRRWRDYRQADPRSCRYWDGTLKHVRDASGQELWGFWSVLHRSRPNVVTVYLKIIQT